MEVKYTHLITSPDWPSAYHIAVINRRLHYKVLRTGEVSAFAVNANSVEALYGDNAAVIVTPLNKFTGNV